MQAWQNLRSEGMQANQGQAEEEQRDIPEDPERTPRATQASISGQNRWKGKEPVQNDRHEDQNPLGVVGPHETAFIMQANMTAMLAARQRASELA